MARAAAPSTKPVAKRSTATDKVTKKTVRGKPSGSKAATVKKATQTAAVSREANAKDATVSDTSASKQTRSADVSDPNLSSNTTPSQSKLVSTKKDGSTIAGAAQTVNSLDHVNDEHAPPKAPVRKDDMPEKTAAASPVGTKNKVWQELCPGSTHTDNNRGLHCLEHQYAVRCALVHSCLMRARC